MRSGKVFPLQARLRKFLFNCLNESIDEIEIFPTGNPFLAPTEVLGIVEPFRVVGSHIQDNGQRPFWMNSTDERIQGKFANWNPEASNTLVTETQNPFAVCNDNDIDLRIWPIPQERRDRVTQRIRNKQSAWSTIDVTKLLTRLPDHRRIDNRRHLFDVIEQKPVKQDFVGILQSA